MKSPTDLTSSLTFLFEEEQLVWLPFSVLQPKLLSPLSLQLTS